MTHRFGPHLRRRCGPRQICCRRPGGSHGPTVLERSGRASCLCDESPDWWVKLARGAFIRSDGAEAGQCRGRVSLGGTRPGGSLVRDSGAAPLLRRFGRRIAIRLASCRQYPCTPEQESARRRRRRRRRRALLLHALCAAHLPRTHAPSPPRSSVAAGRGRQRSYRAAAPSRRRPASMPGQRGCPALDASASAWRLPGTRRRRGLRAQQAASVLRQRMGAHTRRGVWLTTCVPNERSAAAPHRLGAAAGRAGGTRVVSHQRLSAAATGCR